MKKPKENKRKPRDRTPKSTAGTIPKAALKAVWLKTKEQARTAARENDTESRQQEPTDLAGSAAEQSAAFVWHQGRKFAETQARQHRQKEAVARAHAAGDVVARKYETLRNGSEKICHGYKHKQHNSHCVGRNTP